MKASEGHIGRVFIVRLEDGDIIPHCIERFAAEKGITHGHVVLVGGIGSGDVVTGPRTTEERPPIPIVLPLDGAHEAAGVGIIAPDEQGKPVLHIHAALGRTGKTTTGCLRNGVTTWVIAEAIIYEILGATATRRMDKETGFELLEVEDGNKWSEKLRNSQF